MSERLNKYLAFHLGISRREADARIESGEVYVDGIRAEIGARCDEQSIVTINNIRVKQKTASTCILLNKPRGYVSSRKQQGDTPTIYSLLPKEYHHLKPVGRLDKDSSGLLLLSDDGDFAYHMTHPKYYKVKEYTVTLDKPLEPLHQQMINDYGIQLEDGKSALHMLRLNDTRDSWQITMHEGRNRQIRRTFAALGYTVQTLHRTRFGSYSLADLPTGKFQLVDVKNA